MRYFYDTEFIEDGETIELVSIGIVGEDGSEYYAVSTDFNPAHANAWVRENVLDKLPSPSNPVWKSCERIREELLEFFAAHATPVELWAWVGAYDHVVLAQLWGDMTGLPKRMPRFTRELKQ
ncbi:polyadenylate-specific 3'-exoribonuclease AS, partial [Corynebacterium striatum]